MSLLDDFLRFVAPGPYLVGQLGGLEPSNVTLLPPGIIPSLWGPILKNIENALAVGLLGGIALGSAVLALTASDPAH